MGMHDKPPYYITAYGIAVKHGFKGTIEQWLASLHGDNVELRYVGDKLQWRRVKNTEEPEPEDGWQDLLDMAGTREEIFSKAQQEVLRAEAAVGKSKDDANRAEGAAGRAEAAAEKINVDQEYIDIQVFSAGQSAEIAATAARDAQAAAERSEKAAKEAEDKKPKDVIVTAEFEPAFPDESTGAMVANGISDLTALEIATAIRGGATVKLIDNDNIVYEYDGYRLEPSNTMALFRAKFPTKEGIKVYRVNIDNNLYAGRVETLIAYGGGGSANAVLYTPQTLTEEQKAQARENIGVAEIPVATEDDIGKALLVGADRKLAFGSVNTELQGQVASRILDVHPSVGEVIDACQPGNKWYPQPLGDGYTSRKEADMTDYFYGTQSIKFDHCVQLENLNLDAEGKEFRIRFKVNSIQTSDEAVAGQRRAALLLYISEDSSWKNFTSFKLFEDRVDEEEVGSKPIVEEINNKHQCVQIGEWVDLILPWSATSKHIKKVCNIRLRFFDGTGNANLQMVSLVPMKRAKGIVSFTFDDGLETQYTNGARILGLYGIPATAYIIPEAIRENEDDNSSAGMTEAQLYSLKNDYGWDIESHYGIELDRLTVEELNTAFSETKQWIQDRGLGKGTHFAYPGGVHSERIIKEARKYFDSCRTIDYSTLNGIESTSISNPFRIRAISAVGDNPGGFSIANSKAEIDNVVARGGWLIFVFHSIANSPETAMYCRLDDLEDLARYAVNADVEIKTVAEVLSSL